MAGAPPTFDEFVPSSSPSAERKARGEEANIGQSGASARSSAATAAEKEATLPSTVRESKAKATIAEVKAEQAKIALDKAKAMMQGLPPVERIGEAQRAVLVEIRNLAKAQELSKSMFGASGLGQSTTSYFSGSPASTVKGLLLPVQANSAFEALQKMRKESPTGAGLGNVTERELQLLYSKEGTIDPTVDDATFQQGTNDLIANRLEVANALNTDPALVAEALGPDLTKNFAPMIKAYRFRPMDEEALNNYVKTNKAKGTFDPTDYAALTAQAYYSATGKEADENFVRNALRVGEEIKNAKGTEVAPLDYSVADKAAQGYALQRAAGEQGGLTFGQAVTGAAINVIPNAFEVGYDTIKALTVDAPDTIVGIAKIVAGATGLSDDKTAVKAIKDYYVDRYGSEQGFYKALREQPASILADIAGIATFGATTAAKTLGTAGRVSKIGALAEAAKKAEGFADAVAKIDPLVLAGKSAAIGGRGAAKVAEGVGIGIPARAAGVTTTDVKQAVGAGRRGSPEFVEQMTETGDVADPIAKAQQAITELYQQRSNEYTRRMNRLKKDPEELAFDDVTDAIEGVRNVGRHKGIDISSAADVWDQVDAKTMEFVNNGLNTIEDFDAMKRAIGNIRDTYQRGTPQYRVANDVVKAINNTIVAKAPIYANVMNDYRVASDVLSDVTASLSTGAKSADTTLNKLRRVASGKGARGRTVLDLLEQTQSGKGLGDMLAGLAMSGREPAGVTPTLATGSAMIAGSPEPLLGTLLSPRALGEMAYKTGQGIGGVERAMGAIGELPGVPTVVDTAKRLYDRYGVGTARGVRMANPILIQPQVSDFEYNPPSEEEVRAALTSRYLPGSPGVTVVEKPGLTLESLRSKYEGPVLPSLLPEDEEEKNKDEEPTGFARGGRIFAPSPY